MTPVGTRIMKYGGLSGALLAIIALLTFAGSKLPMPAMSSDIMMVQADINALDRRVTNEALDANQLRIYQNLRERDVLKVEGRKIPDYILQEQTALESKKRKLEARLRGLK